MKSAVAITAITVMLLTASVQSAQEATRNTMQQILASLSALIHIGGTPEGFAHSQNQVAVDASLSLLAENAGELTAHAEHSDDLGFGLLAGSLASDAQASLDFFREGNVYESRLLVDKMTNACFACHARLPGTEGPGMGATIMEQEQTRALPLRNQLRLAVATRELSTAMDLGESLLRSSKHSALYMDASGAIDDYLRVAVRVRGDFKRPLEVLRDFRNREDLPEYLVGTVDSWLQALETLDPAPYTKDKLQTAQRLIDQGRARNTPGDDRRGLVHFMQASGLLHQYVESEPPSPQAEAEAYYLLGLLELELNRNPWPAEAEFYLEAAIRAHPGSPTAQNAYRLLQESVARGYAGSLGAELPSTVQEKLHVLGELAF